MLFVFVYGARKARAGHNMGGPCMRWTTLQMDAIALYHLWRLLRTLQLGAYCGGPFD
jgi:hypothetical protein